MFNLERRATAEVVTFSPLKHRRTALVISIEPLVILVEMLRVWKKEVCPGSRSVGPAGMVTLMGAMTPALAPAGSLEDVTSLRIALRSPLVKTKPMLPLIRGRRLKRAGFFSAFSRRTLRIIVFFPMRISPRPRMAARTVCICLDPTKSTVMIKMFLKLLRHVSSLAQ